MPLNANAFSQASGWALAGKDAQERMALSLYYLLYLFQRRFGGACYRAIHDLSILDASQPRQLAFAQLTRREYAFIAHGRVVDFPVQVFPDLPVSHTAHRWHGRR
jgi:hypothetical protein